MTRYGNDYDRWAERSESRPWEGWGAGYGEGGGRWRDRPESGWSRPEFNVSPRAFGSTGGGYGGWREGRETRPGPRDRGAWGTGASWTRARSGATATTARQIMTENPEAVTPDTSLVEVARRMRDLDVGIIPVVRDLDDAILEGVVTDRDIAVRAAAEGKDMNRATAGQYMSRDVETVGEGATVRDVFSVMKRRRVRRVPVTDDSGRLVGIIAQADLAVDYAGLDLDRETEVEEVLERVSEPARPRRLAGPASRRPAWREGAWAYGESAYDRGFAPRLRARWDTLKREARHLLDRGYDGPYF